MARLVTGSWSYLGQSKLLIFIWVGGWDIMGGSSTPNFQIAWCFLRSQSISSSEGCSCDRVQFWFLSLSGRRTWSRTVRRAIFLNPLDPTSGHYRLINVGQFSMKRWAITCTNCIGMLGSLKNKQTKQKTKNDCWSIYYYVGHFKRQFLVDLHLACWVNQQKLNVGGRPT